MDIFNLKLQPIILQFQSSIISKEVEDLKNYFLDIHSLAKSKRDKLKKAVDKLIKSNPTDEHEILENHVDQYDTYNQKYIELTNNNALVSAYSFFEHQLKDIAQIVSDNTVAPRGSHVYNKRISYAENELRTIKAITGFKFSTLNSQWKKIDRFRKIRNNIIHNGANIKLDRTKSVENQKDYKLISSFPTDITLDTKNGDFYITNRNLVLEFLDLCEEYLKNLIQEIETMNPKNIK